MDMGAARVKLKQEKKEDAATSFSLKYIGTHLNNPFMFMKNFKIPKVAWQL